jgi:hypothetical protein
LICFWNFRSGAVLFPTFALQYHVPFRNEIEQRAARASEGLRRLRFFIYGEALRGRWLTPDVGTLFAQFLRERLI